MKAYIGPYIDYIGPFQLSDFLEHFFILERDRDRIGDWLSKTWVNDFCQWLESKRKRINYIKTDSWDSWSADHTMAMLILPIMKDLKNKKQSYGFILDEDVPEELRSTNSTKNHEYDWDDLSQKRYEWVLDEIIWSLDKVIDESWEDQFHTGVIDINWVQCKDDSELMQLHKGPNDTHKFDIEGYREYNKRIDNGLRLFGVYFRTFWR